MVNVYVCNVSAYPQADSFVRIDQIEDQDIPLHDASLSHVISLRASFRMYGCDYSRGTLFVTFHPGMSAEKVNALSTSGVKAGHQDLNNSEGSVVGRTSSSGDSCMRRTKWMNSERNPSSYHCSNRKGYNQQSGRE